MKSDLEQPKQQAEEQVQDPEHELHGERAKNSRNV